MKKILLACLSVIAAALPGFSASKTLKLNFTSFSNGTSNSYAVYNIEDVESSGFNFNLVGNRASDGIIGMNYAKGCQLVMTANANNCNITKIKVSIKTPLTGKRAISVYKSPTAYTAATAVGSKNVTLSGVLLGTCDANNNQNGLEAEVNDNFIGLCYSGTSSAVQIESVEITYDEGAPINPDKQSAGLSYGDNATVDVDLDEDSYTLPTLANPNNLDVTYSSSDEAVATVAANGEVTLTGKFGTTIIKAQSEENDTYNAGSASYILNVTGSCKSIAEFIALGDGKAGKIGFPMTVAFANGKNVFAFDKAGDFIQIYGTNPYSTFDIIPAGWEGKYKYYNDNTPEIEPVGNLPEATETAEFTPETVAAADITLADVNKVLLLKKVIFDEATPATKSNFSGIQNGETVSLYNNYTLDSVEAGAYNVRIAVQIYKNNLSLYVASIETYIPELPEFDNDVEMDEFGAIKGTNKVSVNFKKVDGIDIYYKLNAKTQSVAIKAECTEEHGDFTKHAGEAVELTSAHASLEYFACDPETGSHSAVKSLNLNIATGVAEIERAFDGEAEYYNLQGARVAAPEAGLYIRVANGKAEKVIVK